MMRWILLGVSWAMALAMMAGVVYLISRSVRRSDDPARMLFKWILTAILVVGSGIFIFVFVGYNVGGAIVGPLTCMVLGVALSIIWTPNLASWFISPITSAFDGGNEEWDPGPLYSSAMGRRKRGQFQEALAAVQKQLARYPQDFHGQLLLAEIYADDLGDLATATSTVQNLCRQPGHSPKNIAFALNELADWQLKLGHDHEAARASLQMIVDWWPDSEQALAASQRLAHLADGDALAKARDRSAVTMRAGITNVGLRKDMPSLQPKEESAEELAQRYVTHLEQHPLDQEIREKLARLYAEHYQRVDLAVDQLEQLISLPSQSAKAVAHWLEQMADWHVKVGVDREAARLALQRIMDTYPGSAAAELANQRLARLELELKGHRPDKQPVKMGVYEQNLGLKKKDA